VEQEAITPPRELAVLGGGSWGTALAVVLAPRFERIQLWVHDATKAAAIAEARENAAYLPQIKIPENVLVSAEAPRAAWVLSVVPSRHLTSVLRRTKPEAGQRVRVISATKGIEAETFCTMSAVVEREWSGLLDGPVAALSGPTFAKEVAAGLPAAIVAASQDEVFARALQTAFAVGPLRLYTNRDIAGVELSGALKNCIAIAAGAVEGLGAGSNSTAALITRGLAEIGRLVEACGGKVATVAGLAGLGDLVLTCTGQLSRNRRVGIELAKGRSLDEVLAGTSMVAEGVATTPVALALAATKGIEMPITAAVAKMLAGYPPRHALQELVERAPKSEA
jgi:glycerol-3-phosphate dehydrogenase (NAD(P)+)